MMKTMSQTSLTKVNIVNAENSDLVQTPSDSSNLKQQICSRKFAKRLSKNILSCGSNFQAALSLLYQSYPQLEEPKPPHEIYSHIDINSENMHKPESMNMDPRVISTTIDSLRRANQQKIAFQLFNRVLNIYQLNRRKTSFENANNFDLSMIFKSIINMLGHTHTSERNATLILEMLHDDIPKYNDYPPPMDMYHAVISALGRCKRMDLVETLLQDMESSRTNRVDENSCGMKKTWEYDFPIPDRLAYLTAITASIRAKESHCALNILRKMQDLGMSPDVVSYNQVLASLAKSGDLRESKVIERHVIALEILNEMEDSNTLSPNDATYDTVISICGKDGKWDIVSRLTDHQKNRNYDDVVTDEASLQMDSKLDNLVYRNKYSLQNSEYLTDAYKNDLEKIEKVGRGRIAWHKFGHYSYNDKNMADNSIAFGFGIQMHKNPRQNGLSVVFYEEKSEKKLGYMLIRNTLISAENVTLQSQGYPTSENFTSTPQFYSSLLGMYIAEDQRGKGLANKFIAVWLQLCMRTNTLPRTEKINKPLLSLVLSKFGFHPDEDSSGIDVEVSPISHINTITMHEKLSGWKPVFAVYSPTLPLDGSFGERDLRMQKMVISRDAPVPRGKVTRVKTTFTHPITKSSIRDTEDEKKTDLRMYLDAEVVKKKYVEKVKEVLGGNNMSGKLKLQISDSMLNRALFGFCLGDKAYNMTN